MTLKGSLTFKKNRNTNGSSFPADQIFTKCAPCKIFKILSIYQLSAAESSIIKQQVIVYNESHISLTEKT